MKYSHMILCYVNSHNIIAVNRLTERSILLKKYSAPPPWIFEDGRFWPDSKPLERTTLTIRTFGFRRDAQRSKVSVTVHQYAYRYNKVK